MTGGVAPAATNERLHSRRPQAAPFWFGPSRRPLFGWWHRPPDGQARATVVLCPPIGIEGVCAYFTYRTLADRLASSGLAALRFDYDGTGDSAGDGDDPDRVPAWRASVRAAIEVAQELGPTPLALVGMRLGALLAATEAAARDDINALVLWDPCTSGRTFMREQRTLHQLGLAVTSSTDGAVDTPGLRLKADTVSALEELDLRSIFLAASRRLILVDPDRPTPRWLRDSRPAVEVIAAAGQSALLDPPRQETPWATMKAVASWLDGAFSEASPVLVDEVDTESARVACGTAEAVVRERPFIFGEAALFGIVTESRTPTASRPAVVLIDEGNTPHTGQSRMWVELARRWGADGLTVLRWDNSGNGDSGTWPGQRPHLVRAPEVFDDVRDAARAAAPEDPSNVIFVGLCSGAYQALEAALDLRPRGVCLINPAMSFTPAEDPVDPRRRARQSTRGWAVRLGRSMARWLGERRAPHDSQRWVRSLEQGSWPASVAARHPRIPEWMWWFTLRALLRHRTVDVLRRCIESGVQVSVIINRSDLVPIVLGNRRALQALGRLPSFHLDVRDHLDHAGLIVDERRQLMDAVFETVSSMAKKPGIVRVAEPGAVHP